MSSQIDRVIAIAEKYIGVKESPPNSNNVIFNSWYYGGPVNDPKLAWCLVFTAYVMNEAGLSHLFYGGKTTRKNGGTASCTTLMNYAKQNGLWVTSGFRRGDLALFDWSGQRKVTQHIGFVTKVNVGGIEAIEGNTSLTSNDNGGSVMRRTRANSLITGAYRPKYEEDKTESEDDDMKRYNTLDELPEWARPTVKKLVSKGAIKGSGAKDKDGNPADMNLSEDMIRLLVWDDRMELYV